MKLAMTLLMLLLSTQIAAAPRIAVLDFELKDLTLAPGIPAELERTASLKPMLERELGTAGYQIIAIPLAAQHYANSGVGYLFDHADAAADLGRAHGADYVVVGRLHKPSYLFAYLMANVARVGDGQWIGKLITESKGPASELASKAVEGLTVKIDNLLEHQYTPPPPTKLIKP